MFRFGGDGAGDLIIGSGWIVSWLLVGLIVGAWRWHVDHETEARALAAEIRDGWIAGSPSRPLWLLGAAGVVAWFVAEVAILSVFWPGTLAGTALRRLRQRRSRVAGEGR